MKRLSNFNLNLIKNKQWYHQRFDACPMFCWFIALAEVRRERRKPGGTEADIRVCFFDAGKGDWYLDMKDIKRGADAIIKLARKDPRISKKLLAGWKKDEGKFDKFFYKEFPEVNLRKLNDAGLAKLWNKYLLLALDRLTSSSVIDHFALGTDELIGRMLRKELRGKYEKESDFTKLFSIATAPVHRSFISQADIELLKIIIGKSREKLADYQKRYYWSKNNYFIAQNLTVEHFKEEIKVWRKSKKDLKLELERIENTPKKNYLEKQALLKKYKLSQFLKTLLKISEDFTWWQDERKRATYLNIEIGSKILREVSRRTRYKFDFLRCALPNEVEDILMESRPSKQELKNRLAGCAAVCSRQGSRVFIGSDINKIKKIILGNKKLSEIQDFRGLSASTGRAIGTVKIVKSATEIGKVKQGDILVAVMTRPDYVVAMKKAAAIVTNEGGITSHAAIVSRELGIPCIIGTKIATEVLKDGDLVEVNANHGWVRKLNK